MGRTQRSSYAVGMTDNRTFIAQAHTPSGEILSATLHTVDGGFPEAIRSEVFADYSSEEVSTFFLARSQDPAGESADYYLEPLDAAEQEKPSLATEIKDVAAHVLDALHPKPRS
jgi:hypothetical protein